MAITGGIPVISQPFVDPKTGMITRPWLRFLENIVESAGTGAGTVTGPVTSTDNAIARFNGTTGIVLQNSGITIADGATGTLSGSNSGDVTLAGTPDYITLSNQVITRGLIDLATDVTSVLPVANGGSGSASGAGILRATASLTNAQILALPTTPVTIIAAPSAGTYITFLGGSLVIDTTGAAYTNIDATYAACAVYYLGDFTQWIAAGPVDDATYSLTRFTQGFGTGAHLLWNLAVYQDTPSDGNAGIYWTLPGLIPEATFNGTAVAIAMDNNGSGNLTGGNAANSMTVTLYYVVESI